MRDLSARRSLFSLSRSLYLVVSLHLSEFYADEMSPVQPQQTLNNCPRFFEPSDTTAAVVGREGGMGTVGAVSFSAIVLVDKASDVGYGTEVEALEAWPPYRLVRLDTMDYCK